MLTCLWIRSLGRKWLISFALSLHSTQRSKKFIHFSSIRELLPVFFPSIFQDWPFPTRWCSPALLTWQLVSKKEHSNRDDKANFNPLRPKFGSYTVSFQCVLLVRVSHRVHPDSGGRKIPSSQGGEKNCRSVMTIKNIIHYDNKATFQIRG